MGFIDSLKEALGGEKDEPDPSSGPRHADRDAPEEPTSEPHVTGGKHAARDHRSERAD